MRRSILIKEILGIMSVICFASCIKNDIPYPYISAEITEIAVKGQTGEAKIDAVKRTILLVVDETASLDSIVITKLVATEEATIHPDSAKCLSARQFPNFSFNSLEELPANANTAIDCTQPVTIMLKTYQNYSWKVTVSQVMDRTISVENQVGEAVVDAQNKIAIIYVAATQDLKNITIHKLNLEGAGSEVYPDPSTVKDFTRSQRFKVFRGDTYMGEWRVAVVHAKESASTGNADVWAKKATVTGGMQQGATPGVEYKKETETEWTALPETSITVTSTTTFKALITGLEDGVTYNWRVVADGVASDPASFTTEKIAEIPNLNFDTWTLNGKNWYANPVANNYDDPQAYWATGNEGVTSSLAGGNEPTTIPVEGSDAYKGKAAKMTSITGVTLVGAAAGNLFIGTYKTNMTKPSASVDFGRTFTGARPTKMKGYYKYISKPINHGTYPGSLSMDECHIYIKIWDASGNLFGYGEFIGKETVSQYTEFTFDIQYKDLTAKPAKMSIVATSSHYGGDFEGAKVVGQVGAGSTLWVDEFELLYD